MAAPVLQQEKPGILSNSNANLDISFNTTPTVGRLCVVRISGFDQNPNGSYAVSDNQGNTYTRRTSGQATGQPVWTSIWTAPINTASGTFTVTINPASTNQYLSVIINEISGFGTTLTNATTSAGSGTTATANINDVLNESLVLGVMSYVELGGHIDPGASWTEDEEIDEENTTNQAMSAISRVSAGAGALDPTWTISGTATWVASGLEVQPAPAGNSSSVSPSQSPSASISPSSSSSRSPSPSSSVSPSSSASRSLSPSASISPSASVSPSSSVSPSTSPSSSASASVSPSSSQSPSSSLSPSVAPQDAVVWGEDNPDGGIEEQSWQTWRIDASTVAGVTGDPDWGSLQVDDGTPVYSPVKDTGDTDNKTFTINTNQYGSGEGLVTIEIRGDAISFTQFAGSPSWETYTIPVAHAWRYVQVRLTFLA